MNDEYRYCVTYNVYGSRNVQFSDSLHDLHRKQR